VKPGGLLAKLSDLETAFEAFNSLPGGLTGKERAVYGSFMDTAWRFYRRQGRINEGKIHFCVPKPAKN